MRQGRRGEVVSFDQAVATAQGEGERAIHSMTDGTVVGYTTAPRSHLYCPTIIMLGVLFARRASIPMPLFARRPRSLDDPLIALADGLERHAAEIRQLAGQPDAAPKPAIEPGLDDAFDRH